MVSDPREPEQISDTTLRLFGVAPECPGCDGPTYAITAEGDKPWWCPHCMVRLDSEGNYGGSANFPAESQPEE